MDVVATNLDELLARMPAIADAVNAFSSEAVQQQAFRALVGGFGVVDDGGLDVPSADDPAEIINEKPTPGPARKRGIPRGAGAGDKPAKRRPPVKAPAMVNDLNLRPAGKTSLLDFIAAKSPTTRDEQNVLTVYYLKHEVGVQKVNADHVFTAYREMKETWKLPNDIRNSLQVTKSQKGWLDTRDMDDIALTAAGTNVVEHDLPRPKK